MGEHHHKKIDTSAPMEIGMAAKMTVNSREKKETSESWTSQCRLLKKGTGKKTWSFGRGQKLERKAIPRWQRCKLWRKELTAGKKGGKEHAKSGKGDRRECWT